MKEQEKIKCKNPECDCDYVLKCICFGLPMKLCPECSTGWGPGAYLFGWSNGQLLAYKGGYWRTLWYWLTHWR